VRRRHRRTQLAVRGEHPMKPPQVHPRWRHQRCKSCHQIRCGSILSRCTRGLRRLSHVPQPLRIPAHIISGAMLPGITTICLRSWC
jgi:hypothetical protein